MTFDTTLEVLRLWFLDHGWRIIIILLVAILVRRFGVALLTRLVNHSVEASERFENARDRKLRIETVRSLMSSVVNALTGIAATVMILSELGAFAYFAPLFGSAVAVSLILGFGLQAFVKDFISGIFIVGENQYRVGDVVHIYPSVGGGEFEGTVIRISLRTTLIRDNDGAIHFIPNGNIARVANQTLDYAKVNVEVPLPLSADLDKVEKEVGALGIAMSKEDLWHRALVQAPFYHGVQQFDHERIVVEVRAKTIPAEQWRVSSELQKRLVKLVESHNHFKKKTGKKVT